MQNNSAKQDQTVDLFAHSMSLTVADQGEGRTFLLLHGGAGPASFAGLARDLSKTARAILPTHPGFNGSPRPDWFTRISDLALAYLALIEKLDLSEVVIVGNSMGGWLAAEIALRKSPRIAGIVLLNAVGIDSGSPDRPLTDPFKLPPPERLARSFHDAQRFATPPTTPEATTLMAGNYQTLLVYGGEHFMYDPALRARLAQVSVPTLVAWGESDRIVDVEYGRLLAASIPGAHFQLISEAGHLPQIERLDEVTRLVSSFITNN